MTEQHEAQYHHIIPIRTYLWIWVLLMVLLVVTVAAAFIPAMGHFGIVLAMLIAVVKATVVVLWFMHVKYSSRLTQIFVVATLIWLGILFALSFSDYFTRGWMYNTRGWEATTDPLFEIPPPPPPPAE